jgi:exopolysaccharide biosynthesis operon protein EpsL
MIVIAMTSLVITTKNAYALPYPYDTLKPHVGAGTTYDNNLLRLSDSVNPVDVAGKSSKSDIITQVRAGVDADWQLGRQHLIIKTDVNQNFFQNYNELNYLGWDLLGKWGWQLGNHLSGEIGYSNKVSLGSFAQINGLINNLQTQENYFANGGYLFHPDWKVLAGLRRNSTTYDGVGRQISNGLEDTGELELRYQSPTQHMLGLRVSLTDGSYPNRTFTTTSTVDDKYTRNKYEMIWDWSPSSKTRFDGQLGYVQQRYAHLARRDFSDIIARGKFTWRPTEKTNLALSGWREISQANTLTSNFVLKQGIGFTPTWIATSKIELSAPVSYEQQHYLGDPGIVQTGFTQQIDKVSDLGLNLLYQPFDNTEISMMVKHEDRKSTVQTRNYKDQSVGLNLLFAF